MFDFAWSEIGLIAVVALIFIGPKDMPVAIKTVAAMIKKARRMAGEFQGHVDEMVREANLSEVRDQIRDIRNFDIRGEVERAVDSDGSIRSTFAGNPMADLPDATALAQRGTASLTTPADADPAAVPAAPEPAPAFIPPSADSAPRPVPAPVRVEAPSFIPPAAAAPAHADHAHPDHA